LNDIVITQVGGTHCHRKNRLKWNFDVRLQFDPQSAAGNPAGPSGLTGPAVPAGASDPIGPSLFTAIQEQLGLKLESTRGLVDLLVVDSAQKPTEN
jgi:bla regulator protein blaR1